MKKLLCLFLCLLLPVTALAAPTREMHGSALSESELSTLRAWLDQQVRSALPVEYDADTYIGAAVYNCVEDGGCYVLECDVYAEEGSDSLPEFAPNDAVSWLCDATVCVKRGGEGFELVSCETGDYYAAAGWQDVDTGAYAVALPDFYAENARDVYDFSCYDAAGQFVSGVRYRCVDGGQSALEYALSLVGGREAALDVRELPEVNMTTVQAGGMYVIVYDAGGALHALAVTYPEEREAEFTLYAEFMRNSFVVSGEANG